MMDILFNYRITNNEDWATILFVLSFATIATTKAAFENRFSEFLKLLYSDKYMNVYRDGNQITSNFTMAIFFVQLISFAFFIQISLSYFGEYLKTDWVLFIQIVTILLYFILAKFLIEKIIATAFDIEEIIEQFNLKKVVFRSYIGIFLLPLNVFLFYNDSVSKKLMIIIIIIVFIICVLTYLISLKNYQKAIFSKLFYFILYLCALEIAPYYFIYNWFANSIA
jgi:hypothetical protein